MVIKVDLFLHLLLILAIWRHVSAIRTVINDSHSPETSDGKQHIQHHPLPIITNTSFFKIDDLQVGRTVTIKFPEKDTTFPFSPILTPQEATKIPFSLKKLPNILQLFSISPGTRQARMIEDVLYQIENFPAIRGESRLCTTSLESMLDFTRSVLGPKIKIMSSTMRTPGLYNYTVVEAPRAIQASNSMACHTLPYPYAIFLCHSQYPKFIFKTSFVGETHGDRVELIILCHQQTWLWSPSHKSFQRLPTKPGESPVCHFLLADNYLYIPLLGASI